MTDTKKSMANGLYPLPGAYIPTFAQLEGLVEMGLLSPSIFTEIGREYIAANRLGKIHKMRHALPPGTCPRCRGHGCFTTFAFPDGSGAEYEDCVRCGGTGKLEENL